MKNFSPEGNCERNREVTFFLWPKYSLDTRFFKFIPSAAWVKQALVIERRKGFISKLLKRKQSNEKNKSPVYLKHYNKHTARVRL